jgi:hypothetical protein
MKEMLKRPWNFGSGNDIGREMKFTLLRRKLLSKMTGHPLKSAPGMHRIGFK